MRKLRLAALVLIGSLAVAPTGIALEKVAMRVTDEGRDGPWTAGGADVHHPVLQPLHRLDLGAERLLAG